MEQGLELERRRAVERFRAGERPSAIAASLGYSTWWVWKWVKRAASGDVDWYKERSRQPHSSPSRVDSALEGQILQVRDRLQEQGCFHGAQAILWELEELGLRDLPSVRTVGRILARHGKVRRRSGRYRPKGKRYPAPDATRVGEVQQMDFVGPRYGTAPLRFYSLNTVELATGRCAVEPVLSRDASSTLRAIWATWRRLGLPRIQQVDNEMVFFGSPRHPRGMGPLIRLCLHHGVEPLFIPVREPWRNGVVEKFNALYEQRFRRLVHLEDQASLERESRRFEAHHNARYRYSKLGGRTPTAALRASGQIVRYPNEVEPPEHPLPKPTRGRYHIVRFIRSDRVLDLFGERFTLPPVATYEYVRATVDVEAQHLSVHLDEELIHEQKYRLR